MAKVHTLTHLGVHKYTHMREECTRESIDKAGFQVSMYIIDVYTCSRNHTLAYTQIQTGTSTPGSVLFQIAAANVFL